MDLREIGCEDGRWMELAQDRLQWLAVALAVLNFRKLYEIPNSSTCCCRHATSRLDRFVLHHSHSVSADKTNTPATASADTELTSRNWYWLWASPNRSSPQAEMLQSYASRPQIYLQTWPTAPSFPVLPTEKKKKRIYVQSEQFNDILWTSDNIQCPTEIRTQTHGKFKGSCLTHTPPVVLPRVRYNASSECLISIYCLCQTCKV